MTNYQFKDNFGNIIATNLSNNCDNCFTNYNSLNEVIICKTDFTKKRRGITKSETGSIYLCTDEEVKSGRTFRERIKAYRESLSHIIEIRNHVTKSYNEEVDRLIHNLMTYNAHIIQGIYSICPQEEISRTQNKESIIETYIKSDNSNTAKELLRILKNATLTKAEFSVFLKLYDKHPQVKIQEHSIHRITTLILNTFWLDFVDNNITISMRECNHKVFVDYESISAIFAHLINNAVKYTSPNTEISIFFNKDENKLHMYIDMISLKVMSDETEKIFEEGYSGKLPKELKLSGKGIGLFMVKRLMKLNNAEIKFHPNRAPNKSFKKGNISYESNRFELIFESKE